MAGVACGEERRGAVLAGGRSGSAVSGQRGGLLACRGLGQVVLLRGSTYAKATLTLVRTALLRVGWRNGMVSFYRAMCSALWDMIAQGQAERPRPGGDGVPSSVSKVLSDCSPDAVS